MGITHTTNDAVLQRGHSWWEGPDRRQPTAFWEAAGVEQSRRESRWELTTCEARGAYKGSAHDETMCCVRESMW